MRISLAWASLIRHRSRTLLAVLGVAIAAAMLLDMVMLASGMRESFRELDQQRSDSTNGSHASVRIDATRMRRTGIPEIVLAGRPSPQAAR